MCLFSFSFLYFLNVIHLTVIKLASSYLLLLKSRSAHLVFTVCNEGGDWLLFLACLTPRVRSCFSLICLFSLFMEILSCVYSSVLVMKYGTNLQSWTCFLFLPTRFQSDFTFINILFCCCVLRLSFNLCNGMRDYFYCNASFLLSSSFFLHAVTDCSLICLIFCLLKNTVDCHESFLQSL